MTDVTFEKIGEIHKMGTAILLVEQNVSRALSLVQRAYVLESGNVIMQGTSAELARQQAGAGGVSRDLRALVNRHPEEREAHLEGCTPGRRPSPFETRAKSALLRVTVNVRLLYAHHRPLRLDDLEHPRELVHQHHQLAEPQRLAG